MNPVVIVLSVDKKSPIEIISNIIKRPDVTTENPATITIGDAEYPAYVCDIKTKYYETQISLLPFHNDDDDDGGVDAIPVDVLNAAEAIIVYFDAKDKSFLQVINKLNKIVEDNHIELGLLLTDNLCDESAMGLTFKDVKSKCTNTFDLIELCAAHSDDDDDDDDGVDGDTTAMASNNGPSYVEVHQALHNNIWSNIEIPSSSAGKLVNNSSNISSAAMENPSVEDQLEAFDALLNNIQNFKRISANMNRDQVLDEAERIAQLFENILNDV